MRHWEFLVVRPSWSRLTPNLKAIARSALSSIIVQPIVNQSRKRALVLLAVDSIAQIAIAIAYTEVRPEIVPQPTATCCQQQGQI